jgi:hypothetical protein
VKLTTFRSSNEKKVDEKKATSLKAYPTSFKDLLLPTFPSLKTFAVVELFLATPMIVLFYALDTDTQYDLALPSRSSSQLDPVWETLLR